MLRTKITRPLAITMWDFSWLERRWPGAGYEDWDRALDELQERGYDAVRIDAYPHLMALDAQREWELLPVWNQQDWGSPALTRVQVQPALNQFLEKCRARGLRVALSSWFRHDRDDSQMRLTTPEQLGKVWLQTLQTIDEADLLETILYVDLCNEFPLHVWAPYFSPTTSDTDVVHRDTPEGQRWMAESIALLRATYPDLDYCFSFTTEFDVHQDVAVHDVLELHIWMPSGVTSINRWAIISSVFPRSATRIWSNGPSRSIVLILPIGSRPYSGGSSWRRNGREWRASQ